MDDPIFNEPVFGSVRLAIWIGGLLIGVALAVPLLRFFLDRSHLLDERLPAVIDRSRRSLQAVLLVIGVKMILGATTDADVTWVGRVNHALTIALIGAVVWLVAEVAIAIEELILAKFEKSTGGDDVRMRRARTQITLLRRLFVALLVSIGVATALTTFPSVNLLGRSVLASAGLLSVVAGLAAQSTLTNVFAGIQLALSDALRVGDVVQLEGESGVVDDITLTYVVVGLWDDRKLILPSSYFITNPFENWTRSGDRIGGSIFFDLEWTAPIPAMREELEAALRETPLWDGRRGRLLVVDNSNGQIRIRIDLTAGDTGDIFALKAHVRERMVTFLTEQGIGALPRTRVEEIPADATLWPVAPPKGGNGRSRPPAEVMSAADEG